MKKTGIFIVFAMLFLAACSQKNPAPDSSKNDAPAQAQPAAATTPEAVYACPMHPEVTGKEGEKCPKCKMDLVLVDPAAADVYACPMHPEVTGKEGDKCPKCKMDLEPVKK